MTYRAYGKQIKRGSEHIADAVTETYAQIIADALNGERDAVAGVTKILAERYGADALDMETLSVTRQCIGEYDNHNGIVRKIYGDPEIHRVINNIDGSRSCICGRRWDRDEGDECPGIAS